MSVSSRNCISMSMTSSLIRSERMREDVIDIEMQLRDDTDIASSRAIHRHHSFNTHLNHLSRPDQSRIDRAGRPAALMIERRLQGELYDRRDVGKDRAEPNIVHICLQIQQAVFNG